MDVSCDLGFRVGEQVVSPFYGVGDVIGLEEKSVAGFDLRVLVITFNSKKLVLRVPLPRVGQAGIRKLSAPACLKKVMEAIKSRARVKRTMWARRAQEYEAKINSGNLVSVAEVVRDLYRADGGAEQSYSERQLYEAALDRVVAEFAAVNKESYDATMERLLSEIKATGVASKVAETRAQGVPDSDQPSMTGDVAAHLSAVVPPQIEDSSLSSGGVDSQEEQAA